METNQEHENQPQENAHPQGVLEGPGLFLVNPDGLIKFLRKQAPNAIFAFFMVYLNYHCHYNDDNEDIRTIRARRIQEPAINIIFGLVHLFIILPICLILARRDNNRNPEDIGMNH